ncbi:MAG TPA: sigma 54-interacting transcriptional regulator, partial [Sphaerochaeta sp.]|nr:sigma 54-interacting transcriptional regulator [Sphaerochaeta sp.]
HKGTLFLDEIVEMPFNVQAKLLRVLQEREVRKIGADMVIPVDVRIITAANSTIIERVREGAFRLDLFYRISLLTLTLIPLRDRKGDLGILFRHFVTQYCARHSIPKPTITDEAIGALYDFPWPGNIRELRNAAERLAILHNRDVVTASDVEALDIESTSLHIQAEPSVSKPMRTTISDEELYEQFISSGLSRELFAKQVGISRTTLWRKFAKLGG